MIASRRVVGISSALLMLLSAGISIASPPAGRMATIDLGPPGTWSIDARPQVTSMPFRLPPAAVPQPSAAWLCTPPAGYIPADSTMKRLIVPSAKEYCAVFHRATGALGDTLLPYALTATARSAIAASPSWIQVDLENNLRRLSQTDQDRYGNLILGLSDPRILDEVAFQVAHLSYVILGGASWDERLISTNASLMYQIDPELQYVDIVDYGTGTLDQYSTTRYRTIVGSDTTTVEIPREMYYYYIVMPRLSDEQPLMNEYVYNLFWREYLYYQHDEGYPLLRDVIRPLKVLWDDMEHDWPAARAFTDSMLAVDAIGNWVSETVPFAAEGDRPIQPNVIAHEHNGNCGELQDLLCAAGRTCLIPTISTMDPLEDHVWCEIWLADWHEYQVDLGRGPTHIDNPGCAYDEDYGGGKYDSCIWDWRNDGLIWDDIARYSESCSLSVRIVDPAGVPIDNASVIIASEEYYPPYGLLAGTWGETGRDGTIHFVLGDNQNYYVRVTTSLGNYPTSGYAQIISNSVAGQHYYWSWTTTSSMRRLNGTEGTPGGPYAPYLIEVSYDLPSDFKLGRDQYAGPPNYYAASIPAGTLDFFIADHPNLVAYKNRQPFTGYSIIQGASSGHVYFPVPALRDYYIVLSGVEHQGFATCADVTVRLWRRDPASADAAGPRLATGLTPFPNPCTGRTTLTFSTTRPGPMSLLVYDVAGRLVKRLAEGRLEAGAHRFGWDGSDDRGRAVPSGRYAVRLESAGKAEVRPLILVR